MAQQIRLVAVTIPAGTVASSPYVQDVSFPPMTVESISWRMPPGHAGLVGWALTDAGANILPTLAGQWVIASEGAENVKTDGYPDSGGYQVSGYNLGNNPHTVYVTFHLNFTVKQRRLFLAASNQLLSSAPDLSQSGPPVGRQ